MRQVLSAFGAWSGMLGPMEDKMRGAPLETREAAEVGLDEQRDAHERRVRDEAWARYEKTRMSGDVDRISAFRAGWRAARRAAAKL